MGLADRTPPTVEEYLGYRERLSNWGRWGPDDEMGTLNHITAEAMVLATSLVEEGRTVSLSRPLDTTVGPLNPEPAEHEMRIGPRSCRDLVRLHCHGRATTHIDALCHFYTDVDGQLYNGRPLTDVTESGAASQSIDRWRGGVVTRGVLYDIPRLRGTDYATVEEPVHGWDLHDAASAQGVQPKKGDAALVRSGREAFFEAHPGFPDGYPTVASPFGGPPQPPFPGCNASVAEYLFEHDAALLGCDFTDAMGQGYPPKVTADGEVLVPQSLHEIAIPFMGLAIIDTMDLETLAATCEQLGRWEFLLVVAPLVIEGGTGSPVNPIAVF